MAILTLKAKPGASGRIDLSGLAAALGTAKAAGDIAGLPVGIGAEALYLGDVFAISGAPGGDIAIEAGRVVIDNLGAGLTVGTLTLTGNAGNYAGRNMKGGTLDIKGNAGDYLASGMKNGLIHVTGSAANFVGGQAPEKRFGMAGGTVVIDGNIGIRAGDKMRRGLILVRGTAGSAAGSRMCGGTIVAEGGFGPGAGPLLRRGSLIGPKFADILPTFADCGVHELVILSLMSRGWAKELGPLAPRALPPKVRRYAGDLAAIGKGELLLTMP